jgi:transposase
MPKKSKLIDNEVVAKAEKALKSMGKQALLVKKIEAVIAANKFGITLVAKVYDISRTTLTAWIKHIKNDRFEALQAPVERKRKDKINNEQKSQIKEWVIKDPQLTLKAIQFKLKAQYQLNVGISTIQRKLKDMNFSYITPRPKHVNQDKTKVEDFKKKYS